MLQEIMAKLTLRDKLIGGGAIAFVVGWLVGVLLGNVTWKYSYLGYTGGSISKNAFTELAGGTSIALLGLAAAIIAVVVIYLKYAPNMNITWPAPLPVILLGLAAVAGADALLVAVYTFQNMSLGLDSATRDALKAAGTDVPSWPIGGWIALVGMVGGGAAMCWGAYQEWVASKAA